MKTVGYLAVLILPLLTSSTSPFLAPYHWNGGHFVLVRLIPEMPVQNVQQPLIWSMPGYQNILRSGPYYGSYGSSGGSYGSSDGSYGSSGGSYGSSGGSYGHSSGSISIPHHIRQLVDKIIYLRKGLFKLEREEPKCSSLAAGNSVVLGSLCYTVVTTPANYQDALDDCRGMGGTLMEPYQQFSHVLYENLEHKFPLLFKLIKSQGLDQWWIGASADSNSYDFNWESTGTPVTPIPTFDLPPPPPFTPPPTYDRGVVLILEGIKWKAVPQTDLHPYVCWSTPV